ncbi:MAG: tetratricopeptide repeat protein [Candidatus Giovannonibacteria bacterium]|nr:MAG: tetratricopeptide repeat protein [Candidatus Giovannonibacteria bacterium]
MTISSDSLHKAAEWCLLALAFLLPVWFLPVTIAPVEFNKLLMVSVLVFLSFVLYLAHSIRAGSVSLPYHHVFIIWGAFLLSVLASAVISRSGASLWGIAAEPSSFLALLTFSLMSFMIMTLFSEPAHFSRLMVALGLGLTVFLAMVWIFSVFGLGQSLGGLFAARAFNPVGSWNSVGFTAAFFLMLLYPFLSVSSGAARWVMAALFLLSLLLVLVVNFPVLWGIIGFFAILLLSYGIWRKNTSLAGVGFPLALLLVALFAFLFTALIASSIAFPAPLEVGVSHSATLQVAGKALKENTVFGTGPASFGYLWDKYKPAEVNNTLFWGLRFTLGSSYILSALGETGVLGWALLLAFFGWLWYLGLKALASAHDSRAETLVFAAFLLFSLAILMFMFYSAGYVLAALGFFAMGLLLAALRISGAFKIYEFSLVKEEGPRGFISALVVVFFIILGALGLYLVSVRYVGQLAYAKGLEAINAGNLDEAERKILIAAQTDGANDLYLRTLSQVYMSKGQLLLQDRATPPDILGSRFKDFLDRAVSAAQAAEKAEPQDFLNYRALGQIYSFLVQLGAAGGMEAAQAQYDEALKRAPSNPLLWRDKAVVYLSDAAMRNNRDSLKKAEENLLKAVSLKPDYVEGHFLLAQVYDAEGQAAEAIKRGEAAALLAPNDIGTLFQLGLLYYRANRLSDAEIVFGRAVEINANYSNARYFLGLIYDRGGRRAEAVSEFEKILALNPDNGEVKQILSNLRAKKAALAGIAGPAPEKRSEPPVKGR